MHLLGNGVDMHTILECFDIVFKRIWESGEIKHTFAILVDVLNIAYFQLKHS